MIAAFIVAAQVVAGVQQGGPPRDAPRAPAQIGTAVIRGRVFAADTGRPLRRANVSVNAPELGSEPRQTSTGIDGRYEIKEKSIPTSRSSSATR
jgi:hypothetical protein